MSPTFPDYGYKPLGDFAMKSLSSDAALPTPTVRLMVMGDLLEAVRKRLKDHLHIWEEHVSLLHQMSEPDNLQEIYLSTYGATYMSTYEAPGLALTGRWGAMHTSMSIPRVRALIEKNPAHEEIKDKEVLSAIWNNPMVRGYLLLSGIYYYLRARELALGRAGPSMYDAVLVLCSRSLMNLYVATMNHEDDFDLTEVAVENAVQIRTLETRIVNGFKGHDTTAWTEIYPFARKFQPLDFGITPDPSHWEIN